MKRVDEGGVKDRESVEYNSHGKKKIEKGGENNPPTIEHTRRMRIRHLRRLAKLRTEYRAEKMGTARMCILSAVHPCQIPGKLKSLRSQERRRPMIVGHRVHKDKLALGAEEKALQNFARCETVTCGPGSQVVCERAFAAQSKSLHGAPSVSDGDQFGSAACERA